MAAKTFNNQTGATFQITLFGRQGDQPFNQGSTATFTLSPFQSLNVQYGDPANPFLNGLSLFTTYQGDLYSKVQFVLQRESPLDNLLNTNDTITITQVQTDFILSGSNL
ncbi:hypothetical protein GJU40_18370 [Bacillus lacus]|uniref:Uncharacterized protein n=1 Tax=Metabacillus lacus TaxID=1983721 RepID=A0A7X2M126_9BACI|nr:hypothetical protein [Metabacillus lacus]MRX74092.1 hypothetical protein [Metabacillus lacus]